MPVENEEEYLETDVRKILLEHLKSLGMDAEIVEQGKTEVEKPPYYSFHLSATPIMVDNMGCIKVNGKNFDYVHVIRRG